MTCEADRTTDFKPRFPLQEAYREGRWEDDAATLDDQALSIDVAGKGLVVMTGCGHPGIVNTVRYARRLTGKAFEPIIERTVDTIAELQPQVVVPAHCTDWKAQQALARRLADAYTPNAVGATFEL